MDKWITRKSNANQDCDENNNEDEDEQNETPAKKKKYSIYFRKEWKLSHPWIEDVQCSVCCVPIYGNLSHIVRHANSVLHKKKVDIAKSTPKMSNFALPNSEEMRIANSAKELENRFCLFVAEHNLPFASLDHLNQCVKTVKDSKIISKMCINRQKGQKIIRSVTGPQNCKSIANAANRQYYSIIIDESTDVSMKKNLTVVIRIFSQKCRDRFLDFAPDVDSSSAGIFNGLLEGS